MNMTRRDFGKRTGAGLLTLAVGSTFTLSGCNVFTDIENWIPVGRSAFQGIVTLLTGAGLLSPPIAMLVPLILAGFDDILADVKAYRATQPPPAGLLAKIEEVFNLLVGNFQSLLSQVAANPIAALVIGLAQIILSTIAGFLGQLPAATSSLQRSRTFRVGSHTVAITPQQRSIRQFKRDYNAAAAAGGHPEIELHVSLLERL